MTELTPAAESREQDRGRRPEPGTAICLSGGGYRAMLFHVGALWRLNEAGYLPKLERVSSVSGGSITAGVLGLAWPKLGFDESGVAQALPGRSGRAAAEAGGEDDRLPGDRARPDHSRRHDRRAGRRRVPQAPLRPRDPAGSPRQAALRLQRDEHPVGSPLALREAVHARLPRRRGEGAAGRRGNGRRGVVGLPAVSLAGRPEARRGCVHAGIGRAAARAVHDPAVSDGRWRLRQPRPRDDLGAVRDDPDLGRRRAHEGAGEAEAALAAPRLPGARRDRQPGARVAQALGDRRLPGRPPEGDVLGDLDEHRGLRAPVDVAVPARPDAAVAATPTRLGKMDGAVQERLINWGYAVCDAAMRRHVDPGQPADGAFPYPEVGVGSASA